MGVFETKGMTVRYGGVLANDAVTLRVDGGVIVGLIGPNGAGKTTLIDAVTGFTPSAGEVWLAGREISRLPVHRRARLGLARTWQSLELFGDLSVLENALVVSRAPTWRSILLDIVRPHRRRSETAAREALAAVGLGTLADWPPGELSLGRQKLVGVARALASAPAVLLLDEPAAGLDTRESAELGRRLRSVADGGVGLLLVDHDMELVLEVCDRVYALEFGRIIAEGPPSRIRADKAVLAAYLGGLP